MPKHITKLPKNRKPLADWTTSQIRALISQAKTYRGQARIDFVEQSGVSMGTFYRWRRSLTEGVKAPQKPKPRSQTFSQTQRLAILSEYANNPDARQIAKKYNIYVATLYAWRKKAAADRLSIKDQCACRPLLISLLQDALKALKSA